MLSVFSLLSNETLVLASVVGILILICLVVFSKINTNSAKQSIIILGSDKEKVYNI